MNRPCLSRCGWLTLMALLPILLVPGCNDDNPVASKPKPSPSPHISMSLACNGGLIDLTVRNTGASMTEPDLFVAAFEDGQSDTLLLSLDADDSTTCQLSNIHGSVTVTNEERDLEETADDCLAEYFESFGAIDIGGLIPSPLTQTTVVLCVYTVYLRNLEYDHRTFQLIRTDDGLTLRYVYSALTGDLAATSPGPLCVDLTGDISISSVVIEADIVIGAGEDPPVTLGETKGTVNGVQINVDGTFGFIAEWITNWAMSSFASAIAVDVGSAIEENVPSDLSGLVIVRSSCAE